MTELEKLRDQEELYRLQREQRYREIREMNFFDYWFTYFTSTAFKNYLKLMIPVVMIGGFIMYFVFNLTTHKGLRDPNTLSPKYFKVFNENKRLLNLNFHEAYEIRKFIKLAGSGGDVNMIKWRERLKVLKIEDEILIKKQNKLVLNHASYAHWTADLAKWSGIRMFRHSI